MIDQNEVITTEIITRDATTGAIIQKRNEKMTVERAMRAVVGSIADLEVLFPLYLEVIKESELTKEKLKENLKKGLGIDLDEILEPVLVGCPKNGDAVLKAGETLQISLLDFIKEMNIFCNATSESKIIRRI
ncbi:MAG: hypothetical protein ACW963_09000 [Candidatus Sifarchaeia archaeon]|jgi:hypothetical protein